MKMKTVDLFCASPASTAICTTMNQHAIVRRGGGSTPRPIHHHYYNNHYQFDFGDKPKFKAPAIPCTSQRHIDPKPYAAYLQKKRRSASAAASTATTTTAAAAKNVAPKGDEGAVIARRKSSADVDDVSAPRGSSSRHLLSNTAFIDDMPDADDNCNTAALVVSEQAWPEYSGDSLVIKKSLSSTRSLSNDSPVLVKSKSSSIRSNPTAESPGSKSSRPRSRDQVVELRVSIHCKGCEGKVRKHISRMEGVRSFHIDLESKKVTIVGDVTPLNVLSSISKVKNAQFWPSSSSSSSSSFVSSSPSPFIAIRY